MGLLKTSENTSEQRGPVGYGSFIATLAKITFLKPTTLMVRLLNDESRRKKTNAQFMDPKKQLPMASSRKLAIYINSALILIQLISIAMIFMGVGTTGKGPEFFLKRAMNNGLATAGSFSDLINIGWVGLFFLASPMAWMVHFHTFFYNIFKRERSDYGQMMIALKHAGLDAPADCPEPWYYDGRVLDTHLVGRVGDDVIKNESFWKEAGFEVDPSPISVDGTNRYLFIAALRKPTTSTVIYDRYDEWTEFMNNHEEVYKWWLGEYVTEDGYHLRDCFDGFSTAFVGVSGSGKTEAMKCWLTAFMLKHPNTRAIICDLKEGGSWDPFAPVAEYGRVIKTQSDVLKAIVACYALIKQRQAHMKKHGYDDFRTWSEREGIDVPPILLVIDEFPQLYGPLKYDMQSTKEGTPANALFKLLTMGRAYGIWFAIGSQFAGSDAIPLQLNKNIKVHCLLRVGTESESFTWIERGDAARIGKRVRLAGGGFDPELGYGYIDHYKEFVRFWYLHDWFIVHELIKYKVPTLKGKQYLIPPEPKPSKKIRKKIEEKGVKSLNREDKESYLKLNKALEKFRKTLTEMVPDEGALAQYSAKEPLLLDFTEEESVEEYLTRLCHHMDVPVPENISSKGSRGRGGSGGSSFFDFDNDDFFSSESSFDEPTEAKAPTPSKDSLDSLSLDDDQSSEEAVDERFDEEVNQDADQGDDEGADQGDDEEAASADGNFSEEPSQKKKSNKSKDKSAEEPVIDFDTWMSGILDEEK